MSRLITVVAVVAVLAGLFYFGLTRTDKNRDIPAAVTGQQVRDFNLPVYERYQSEYGPTFKLSDYKGKPIVLNFWASWCDPCIEEMPLLQATYQEYKDEVLFIGVQTQERGNKKEAGNNFLDRFNITYPNVVDDTNGKSLAAIDYALFGLPETFFIRVDGTLLYKHPGPLTEAILTEKIGALLQ
jgi:cytochrome c biogenesis protein CcmG, thiol:disulfide interchange protein DsbE